MPVRSKIYSDKNPTPVVCFKSFGCRSNQAETHILENLLIKHGYSLSDDPHQSDLSVINTCTVTEKTDADTRKLVRRIVRANPRIRIALIGCQTETQAQQLAALPNVKWVIGNARKMELDRILTRRPLNGKPRIILEPIPENPFTLPAAGISSRHTRANLKIQDGCNGFCSYCEIPYVRGRARSRFFDDIIKEARCLAEAGHQEIVLTGINIGNYRHTERTLPDIIRQLEKIPKIRRIRISSIEPDAILMPIADMMKHSPKLCRHLHIPIQHVCDPVLKLMNRRYTFANLQYWFDHLVNKIPDICIGTDIICGFPQETEALFSQMRNRLRCLPVYHFHVFSYSKRKLAASKDFSGHLPRSIILERSRTLRADGLERRRTFYKRYLGTTQPVLWEQKKNGYYHGLTDNFIHVRCRSTADLTNRITPCRFITIKQDIIMAEPILNKA